MDAPVNLSFSSWAGLAVLPRLGVGEGRDGEMEFSPGGNLASSDWGLDSWTGAVLLSIAIIGITETEVHVEILIVIVIFNHSSV